MMQSYDASAAILEDDPRLSLDLNSPCSIYSRSKKQWLKGTIDKIHIDPITNEEWLIVKYGNNKKKKIQRFCNDLQENITDNADHVDLEKDDEKECYNIDPRELLDVGSSCKIYSRSKGIWFVGIINKIFIAPNTNQEWLVIKYANNKTKKIQRLCQDLQAVDYEEKDDQYNNGHNDEYIDDIKYEFESTLNFNYIQQKEIKEFKVPKIDRNERRINEELLRKLIGKWRQFTSPSVSSTSYSTMIPINDKEFIIATEMNRWQLTTLNQETQEVQYYGIYKYNVTRNKWCLLLKFKSLKGYNNSSELPAIMTIQSMIFDKLKNDVFIYGSKLKGGGVDTMLKLNIITKKYKIMDYVTSKYRAYEGFQLSCFKINARSERNKLHVIGENNIHEKMYSIWNTKTRKLIRNTTFKWGSDEDVDQIIPTNVIYIRSLNKLMIKSEHRNCVQIWIMDLDANECNKMNIKMPFYGDASFVMTSDEKYIIFISKALYFLDLSTMQFYGSASIQLPLSKGIEFNVVIMPYCTENEAKVVTYGYIKNQILDKLIISQYIIPMDIISLISIHWSKDYIYILDKTQTQPNLWGMCVDDILESNLYEISEY